LRAGSKIAQSISWSETFATQSEQWKWCVAAADNDIHEDGGSGGAVIAD
jgi:hypothetical protein